MVQAATVAQVQSLAWEHPQAVGAAKKRKKNSTDGSPLIAILKAHVRYFCEF